MKYSVGEHTFQYFPEGDKVRGQNVVLASLGEDLTKSTTWSSQGYTVEELFPPKVFKRFYHDTVTLLRNFWSDAGIDIEQLHAVSDYHKIIADQQDHLKAVQRTKEISVDFFPLGIAILQNRISEIMGIPLRVFNPYDDQKIFHFRVVRPNTGDNNPLHKDVWLPDYDDCINLYIPIAGSNKKSSLIISPGSHLWEESAIERTQSGAVINGQRFNVPAVTQLFRDAEWIRPDPAEGEVLLFSPYLLHGGAVNLNADMTRISLEVRLWRC
jgi:hypothetical protein